MYKKGVILCSFWFTMGRKGNKVIIVTMSSVFAPYLMNLGTSEENLNFASCFTLLLVVILVVLPGTNTRHNEPGLWSPALDTRLSRPG